MGSLVQSDLDDGVATITMDDGKVNALSPAMLSELNAALDLAEAEQAAVLLAGREGTFSAGFDLKVLRAGGPDAGAMVRAGFDLSVRLLSFPRPVVIECTGHAVAMAAFLLLSADHRVGPTGDARVMANEVAIGLTMPHAAVEICRYRLTPAHFHRAVALAEPFSPEGAVQAGFLDHVVEPAQLHEVALATATALAGLDAKAHAATKLRTRAQALTAIREGLEADTRSGPLA